MKMHTIVYVIFIATILFDSATSIFCYQVGGLIEANLIYQIVGIWAYPMVLLIDVLILLTVEVLRKHIRWSPLILSIPIFAYMKACIINLQLLYGGI